MADSKGGSSIAKSQKFCCEDEDIERLIDLYEARHCLWDIADPTYSKRDVREKALPEIKEELGAQHGRELAGEGKAKSGQNTDDINASSWLFMEKMLFLEQVKKTAKST